MRRPPIERPRAGRGLSARLLALTVTFVLLGEVLIFVPSVARFRRDFLDRIVSEAHLATLTKLGRPEGMIDPGLERDLLRQVGATAVSLWRPDAELMLGALRPVAFSQDLREVGPFGHMRDALRLLVAREDALVGVLDASPRDPGVVVDVQFDNGPMRRAVQAYAGRILALSLLLSGIVASLLFLALRRLIVRPLGDVTERIAAFREMPEDAGRDPRDGPGGRPDEIGIVERELARMQGDLRLALKQKTRLAALGAALGEVNHDLRNILSSAVLISDRLEASADPTAREVAPRLVTTLERAVRLCGDTLRFARERTPEPRLMPFGLRDLVEEVGEAATVGAPALVWRNLVPADLVAAADRDQLYRLLLNLARNSREAIGRRPGTVTCRARPLPGRLEVLVEDDGPGVPEALRPRLFGTFSASGKPDGSGLGLAIAREIARAHGGEVELARTGPAGTAFRLTLPDRAG